MFGIHSTQDLLRMLLILPISILSLSVHEFAHAWSAYRLGDDTAAREGRLTLNPIAHIDPLGTLLLPMLGAPIGWAKPVPVNPLRFGRQVSMRTGMMITAAAGPLSNLLIAVVCVVLSEVLYRHRLLHVGQGGVWVMLQIAVSLNLGLFLFNLIPLPPLDGSRIAERFLPYSLRGAWEQIAQIAPFLLLALMIFGRGFLIVPIEVIRGALEAGVQRIFG